MNYFKYVLEKLNLENSIIGYFTTYHPQDKKKSSVTKATIFLSKKNGKPVFIFQIISISIVFVITLYMILFTQILVNNVFDTEIISSKITIYKIISFVIITIAFLIYDWFIIPATHKRKESDPKNINIYNRELPENLTPAHTRLLVLDGTIDAKTLAATILDLIDRKYLELETTNKEDIFKKDLLISRTTKKHDELFGYEKYIIDWLFPEEKTSSLDLRQKLNNYANNPGENFLILQGLILLSFPLNKYYKQNYSHINKTNSIKLVLASITCYTAAIFLPVISLFAIGLFWILITFLKQRPPAYLLNEYGVEILDEFLDLKKYLIDFSSIDKKSAEMIVLWNHYLSYSIALDIDGIASNEINDFFGNDIYNVNNSTEYNIDETKKLIDNIPNEIEKSLNIYKKRNVIK